MSQILIDKYCIFEEIANSEDIAKIVDYSGKALPQDLVTHLTKCGALYFDDDAENGMAFDIQWYRIDGKQMVVSEFEELDPFDVLTYTNNAKDIVSQLEEWKELSGRMPSSDRFIPISLTDSGNHLMIDLNPNAFGQVIVWKEQMSTWGEGIGAYLGQVADSFNDFLENKLKLNEDE